MQQLMYVKVEYASLEHITPVAPRLIVVQIVQLVHILFIWVVTFAPVALVGRILVLLARVSVPFVQPVHIQTPSGRLHVQSVLLERIVQTRGLHHYQHV